MRLDYKCNQCETDSVELCKRYAEERKAKDRAKAISTIPASFLNTQRDLLPYPEKLDLALQWQFGPKGLLLWGGTGKGKSRIAWKVAEREILAGKTFRHVNSFELSKYPSLFMVDAGAAGKLGDELVSCNLLLLDDVFKAKPTERVEELLFSVVDERSEWCRPCIITLNDTGESLLSRLTPDRGPALIRRMREHCTSIKFDV